MNTDFRMIFFFTEHMSKYTIEKSIGAQVEFEPTTFLLKVVFVVCT